MYPISQAHVLLSQQLVTAKAASKERLTTHSITLDGLDELGEIMSDMLQKQEDVEVPFRIMSYRYFLRFCHRMSVKSSSADSSSDFLSLMTFITVLSNTKLHSTNFLLKSAGEDSTEKRQRRL